MTSELSVWATTFIFNKETPTEKQCTSLRLKQATKSVPQLAEKIQNGEIAKLDIVFQLAGGLLKFHPEQNTIEDSLNYKEFLSTIYQENLQIKRQDYNQGYYPLNQNEAATLTIELEAA